MQNVKYVSDTFFKHHDLLGGYYMIPVCWNEIQSCSWQCYKLFINYILRLHVKSFIPARWESSFTGTKFSHLIVSAPPKQDVKVN